MNPISPDRSDPQTFDVYGMTMLYGATHLLVDAVSVTFYFAMLRSRTPESSLDIFLWYVVLAFAMQTPIGILADRIKRPVGTAILGCLFVAMGPFFACVPLAALLILCTGNALFHVGGGMIALSLSQGRADIPGMFVAPGTLGVAVGVTLGHFKLFPHTVFCVILLGAVILLFLSGRFLSDCINRPKCVVPIRKTAMLLNPAVLFFIVIILRGMIADFISDTGRATLSWQCILPIAVFLGKFLGGFLSDRFGWGRTIVLALLISAPLIFWGGNCSPLLVFGAILFTMSMPVTLAALGNLFPARPGFAFGVTALALAVGAIAIRNVSLTQGLVFFMICFTASLFYCAIRRYNQSVEKNIRFDEKKLTEDMS